MPLRIEPSRDRKLFRILKSAPEIRLPKGRALYRPGDPSLDVFVVMEGYVRLVLPGMERGRPERTVSVALPWEAFGEEAFTDGLRRYGAVAGTKTVVRAIPRAEMVRGLKTTGPSLDAYLEAVGGELYRLRHAQGGSHGPSAAQRLADVLLDLGARCGVPEGRGVALTVRLTHQVLADLSGAHRATVTTVLNDWIYEGALSANASGALVVSRPGTLWARAGYDATHLRPGPR